MKIGSAVVGLHVAVLSVFALTQGCETTKSQGSGQAGARHRGIVRHEYKREIPAVSRAEYEEIIASDDRLYPEDDISSTDMQHRAVSPVEPMGSDYGTTEVYIVQKGDVLSRIAVDFDTTTATLTRMNNLSNPDVLYIGQELRVPAGGSGSAKTTTKSSGPIQKGGSYTIQKGDTLSGIAVAAGVSIDDLRSVNGIQGDKIMAGETISIPSYGKVPSNTKKVSGTSKKKPAPAPKPQVEPEPSPAKPAPAADPMQYDEPVVEPVAAPAEVDMIESKVLYPGETLDDVASQYGVSKAEIMRLNNISDESQVRTGQTLRIPVAE